MARKNSRQAPLFPVQAFIPQPFEMGSIYDMVARFGPVLFKRSDFPSADSERGGTIGWCPIQLSALVVLQGHFGWSDRETVRRASMDMQVKACLGMGIEQSGPGQSTLVRHRQRMQEQGLDVAYLQRLQDILEALELIEDEEAVLIDSVPIDGAGQQLDTYNLLGRAVRSGLRLVARQRSRKVDDVARELGLEGYLDRSIKGRFEVDWTDEASRLRFLDQLVQDALRIRAELHTRQESDGHDEGSSDSGGADTADVQQLIEAIDDVIAHDIERDDQGKTAGIRDKAAGDRRISITDADMRHGRKSASELICGFKAQIVATVMYGFILIARVIKANEHDGNILPVLAKELEAQGATPAWWGGDHAYGTLANHAFFASGDHGELVARMPRPANGGRFTKDEFNYDFATQTLRCPAGQTAPWRWYKQRAGQKGRLFTFDNQACAGCPLRAQCVKDKSAGGRTVFIIDEQERLIRTHLERRSQPEFVERLAHRSTVERVIAGFAQSSGKQARRMGIPDVQFDANLSALSYNLRRFGGLLKRNKDLAQRALQVVNKAAERLFARLLRLLTPSAPHATWLPQAA